MDRLFDFFSLLLLGGAALLSTSPNTRSVSRIVESALLLIFPTIVFLHNRTFNRFRVFGSRCGKFGHRLFADHSQLIELRSSIKALPGTALLFGLLLTTIAYLLFFSQCYLLSVAINLGVGPLLICFAVAIGSLVTLIPISISGLGTREAAMILYLRTAGVPPERALGYSLLMFFAFQIACGLIGACAWLIKPASWKQNTVATR